MQASVENQKMPARSLYLRKNNNGSPGGEKAAPIIGPGTPVSLAYTELRTSNRFLALKTKLS